MFLDRRQHWIALGQCKDGFLYIIHARNSYLGIFNAEEKSFTISRHKFSLNFLFEEYHWDTGAPYGTVKPLKELYEAPKVSEDEKLLYLNNKEEELKAEISALLTSDEI